MATCKDCVHADMCRFYTEELAKAKGITLGKDIFEYFSSGDVCEHFKDRARFVELPYAEWVEDEDMYGDPIYRCSNCSEHFVLEEGTPTDNCYSYCPNCGAKMDEQALKEREENA